MSSMARKETNDVTLDSEIDFIQTPVPKPSAFGTTESCGIPLTNVSLSIILTSPNKFLTSLVTGDFQSSSAGGRCWQ